VIEGHLRTHVIEMMTGGDQEKAIAELPGSTRSRFPLRLKYT